MSGNAQLLVEIPVLLARMAIHQLLGSLKSRTAHVSSRKNTLTHLFSRYCLDMSAKTGLSERSQKQVCMLPDSILKKGVIILEGGDCL